MRPGEIDERDGLVNGPARRRGAGLNPGNRFEKVRLHVLGEERERQRQERLAESDDGNGPGNPVPLVGSAAPGDPDPAANVPVELIADHTRTIIIRVAPTSDVPF